MTRTYAIRTYGCQMNVHDSERLSGLLEQAGYVRSADASGRSARTWSCSTPARCGRTPTTGSTATSASSLRSKSARPGHADRGRRLPGAEGPRPRSSSSAPWVDVVFGTHNLASLPVLLERARHNHAAQVEIVDALAELPVRPADPAGVGLTPPGCPSRSAATTPARSASCRACAARRPTAGPATCWPRSGRWSGRRRRRSPCSGQNVNSYGRSFGDRFAFGRLLRACGEIDGLDRVRFTSPHPRDFTDDVIAAMAETPNVCPQLHMPLQSGSDAVLRGDAALLPAGALPDDHRRGPGRDAGRPRSRPTSSSASRARPRTTSSRPWRSCGGPVRQRLHVPVLAPARHAGRRSARSDAQAGGAGALRPADRCRRRSAWTGTRRWSAPRSRCWSARARAARTPPPAGLRSGPGRPAGARDGR